MHPLVKARKLLYDAGRPRKALAVLEAMERGGELPVAGVCLKMQALTAVLRADEAADLAWKLVQPEPQQELTWGSVNAVVETLVTSGRYREAVEVDGAIPRKQRGMAMRLRDPEFGIVQINVAEAEVNLGREVPALSRLSAWDRAFPPGSLGAAGLAMTRTWIHGIAGRGAEAVRAMRTARIADLGPNYVSEGHFARAFGFLASGAIDAAEEEVRAGMFAARRPASHRHAQFLQARVHAARGHWEKADEWCRAAAENPWIWQGGDGFLFWGDVLVKLGEFGEAHRAWSLAIERDPQSVWAKHAKRRIEERLGP